MPVQYTGQPGAVRHGLPYRGREVMATGVNITVQPVGMSPSQ